MHLCMVASARELGVGQVEAGVARGEARVRVGVHPHDEGLLPSGERLGDGHGLDTEGDAAQLGLEGLGVGAGVGHRQGDLLNTVRAEAGDVDELLAGVDRVCPDGGGGGGTHLEGDVVEDCFHWILQ